MLTCNCDQNVKWTPDWLAFKQDMGRAVRSIQFYLQSCGVFVALLDNLNENDASDRGSLGCFLERGWTRLEAMTASCPVRRNVQLDKDASGGEFGSMEMWDHVSMRLSVWSRGQADIIEQPYREGLLHNPVKGNFSRRDDVQRIKPVVRVMLREFETSVGGVRAAAPQQGHHSFSMRKLPKQSPALREFLGDVRGSLDADSPNARRSRGGCTSPSLRSARRASQSLVIVKEEPSLEVELESERERRSYT